MIFINNKMKKMINYRYLILETLISEGRLEDMIKKYSSQLPEVWIKELSSKDPSGNNKYLEWMIKEVIRLEKSLDNIEADVEKVVESTLCFHENVERLNQKSVTEALQIDGLTPEIEKILKSPKDINAYSVDIIETLCQYFEKVVTKSASRVKIYEDSRYLVVSPLTHKASCQYGAYSNWCVSTSNVSYYNKYTSDGILFFVIDKEGVNPGKPEANSYKFAIYSQFEDLENPYKWQFFDMEDNSINPTLILNLVPKTILGKIYEYASDKFKEIKKKYEINEKELKENSIVSYKYEHEGDNGYIIFIDFSNPKMVNYFSKKFNEEIKINKRVDRVPIIKIDTDPVLPSLMITYFPFEAMLVEIGRGRLKNTKIPKSLAKEYFLKDFLEDSDIERIKSSLQESDINKIFDMVANDFNSYNYTAGEEVVYADNLKVGDVIEFTAPRYPYNTLRAEVIRVSEKSVTLDNGNRIQKSSSKRFKLKNTGKSYKIVDDAETGIKTESRWIRKRII